MPRKASGEAAYKGKWQRRRELFLCNNPLCRFCADAGITEPATHVDHIIPHRGNDKLFWDEKNWQGLCTPHHNAAKQREETHGYSQAIGIDGWPTDPRHPANVASKRMDNQHVTHGGAIQK